MVYQQFESTYITIDLLFCKSEDLSTAYKAYINYRGHVNTNFIKKVICDLDSLKSLYKCPLTFVRIYGDSIDRRAYNFMKKYRNEGPFEHFEFVFSDKNFPKPGLKMYFYVNGKINYIGVDDTEYAKGDYFEIDELKEDMRELYPDIPNSELVPFYVRKWVIFSSVQSNVETAYAEYLDVISELGKEKYDYIVKARPNGTREYIKTQADENENNLSD